MRHCPRPRVSAALARRLVGVRLAAGTYPPPLTRFRLTVGCSLTLMASPCAPSWLSMTCEARRAADDASLAAAPKSVFQRDPERGVDPRHNGGFSAQTAWPRRAAPDASPPRTPISAACSPSSSAWQCRTMGANAVSSNRAAQAWVRRRQLPIMLCAKATRSCEYAWARILMVRLC